MDDYFNLSRIYQFFNNCIKFCLHYKHSRITHLLLLRIIVIDPMNCFTSFQFVLFRNHLTEMISFKHSIDHVNSQLRRTSILLQWLHDQVHTSWSDLAHPDIPLNTPDIRTNLLCLYFKPSPQDSNFTPCSFLSWMTNFIFLF